MDWFKDCVLNELEDIFETSYDLWQGDCRDELLRLGYTTDEVDSCEICEDGKVRFHGEFYLRDKMVTAWVDSIHYVI